MSGNTDFWHNDLFNRIGHPSPGNNLFGADRPIKLALFALEAWRFTGQNWGFNRRRYRPKERGCNCGP